MANSVKLNMSVLNYELDNYHTVIILPHSFGRQSEIQIKILLLHLQIYICLFVVFVFSINQNWLATETCIQCFIQS